MTLEVTRTPASPRPRPRDRVLASVPPAVVPVAVLVLLVVRLLQARDGASPDEGGFLLIAGQWHPGNSLYGDYWVDRPPLLIGLYRLASLTGGLVSLRVIGALAAAATVLLLASTSRRAYGRRAAAWTGLVAAALLVSPLYGAIDVDGELLALPFVALGLRAAVEVVVTEDRVVAVWSALVTGGCSMAAILVKQNLADVVVLAGAAWAVAAWTGRLRAVRLRELVAVAAIGSAAVGAVVMLSAMAHGTSPAGVFDATYPFRWHAAKVIAETSADTAATRLHRLGTAFLLSGVPALIALFVVRGVRRSRAVWLALALVAGGLWAGVSVLSGGSYWLHYLVETVPVVALAAGALSLSAPRWTRLVVAVVVASSAVAAVTVMVHPTPTPGTTVGRALAAAGAPGDSVVSAFGDPDVVRAAGMTSPYPYLWSLPSRTLDPDLGLLRATLRGPDAPTWVVLRGTSTADRLRDHGVLADLTSRYREVGTVCHRLVYLRRGLDRPVPADARSCTGTVLP